MFATPAKPADYYNETRTYLSLNKTISRVAETAGRILCGPILGGLHQKTRRVERWAWPAFPYLLSCRNRQDHRVNIPSKARSSKRPLSNSSSSDGPNSIRTRTRSSPITMARAAVMTSGKEFRQPKELPAPNGDFYEVTELSDPE